MPNRYIIYGLIDPQTDELRYVGRSSSGLTRARNHAGEARKNVRGFGYKANWIRSLQKAGLTYKIIILEETTKDQLSDREIWWIAWYRPFGRLTNISNGGPAERDARAGGLARAALSTPEQKREWGRKAGNASVAANLVTHEQRRERGRLLGGSQSKERHQEYGRLGSAIYNASLTPEQQRERMRIATSAISAEEHSEYGRRGANTANSRSTPKEKSENGYKGALVSLTRTTPEQRSAWSKTTNENMTPEQKQRRAKLAGIGARKRMMEMTPEQRHEFAMAAQAARMAKTTHEQRSASARGGYNPNQLRERDSKGHFIRKEKITDDKPT